jgi:four helix bundle protein
MAAVSRDHRKLRAFTLADRLVLDIYRETNGFPSVERFGLQSQMRRAAVSAACNIVEGCARDSTTEYLNFLNIAAGSASETRYLVDLSARLGLMSTESGRTLVSEYTHLCGQLHAIITALRPGAKP